MMRFFLMQLTAVGLLLGLDVAHAGIVVGGTRVIYPADKHETSITVMNPDKGTDYLVQSWLENADKNDPSKPPFVVTPPLFRLDHESDNILRIASNDADAQLPQNQESLYWLNIRAIAPTPKNLTGNNLQIALNTRIKFIYRPASLNKEDAAKAYQSLTFSRQGRALIIKNPTPFYVTLHSLKVGNEVVHDPGMLAPRKERRVQASGSGMIKWQSINDYGGITIVAKQ